jgi:hypothetical protein
MDLKLTTQDVWMSTLLFAGMDVLVLLPLVYVFQRVVSTHAFRTIGVSSAVFWGVLATVAIFGFWEFYYQYIFPDWMRWLAPLDALLYGAIGIGLWWLAIHLPGTTVLWFVLLGGVQGILEHLLGIYALGILEKVPWLQGIPITPVLVFSFFEYIFYWSLVAWMAIILVKVLRF